MLAHGQLNTPTTSSHWQVFMVAGPAPPSTCGTLPEQGLVCTHALVPGPFILDTSFYYIALSKGREWCLPSTHSVPGVPQDLTSLG